MLVVEALLKLKRSRAEPKAVSAAALRSRCCLRFSSAALPLYRVGQPSSDGPFVVVVLLLALARTTTTSVVGALLSVFIQRRAERERETGSSLSH